MMLCTFAGLGWYHPNTADAETLNAPASTPVATSPQKATAAYVVMQRVQLTSTGGGDGLVTLSSVTVQNASTANVATGRVYLSTTATTTLPADAVQIGRTAGSLWTAGTTTTILISSSTTTQQRSVYTGTPAYVYIVFDMLYSESSKTALSTVTGIGSVADGNATGLPYSSNAIFLAAGGAKATIVNCFDCHGDTSGTGTWNMDGPRSASTGSFLGSHNKHATSMSYSCTICHTGGALSSTNRGHRDGNINMASPIFSGSGAYSKPVSFPQTTNPVMGTCSTIACHSNGVSSGTVYRTPLTWGTAADGACGTCHGVTASNPPTSTRHAQHVATAQGYKYACSECHSAVASVTSDATVTSQITSTTLHVNFAYNVDFDATNAGADAYASKGAQTCSNLYCHSQGSKSTTPYSMPNTTATWAITLSCEGCHDFDKNATNKMHSGSHTAHVVTSSYGCQRCHNVTTTTGTTVTAATATYHVNKLVNIDFDSLNAAGTYSGSASLAKTPGTAFAQCATTYCHGSSGTPTWSTSNGTLNCASCHGATNALQGKHALHYGTTTTAVNRNAASNPTGTTYVFNCGVCHNSTPHAEGPVSSVQSASVVFDPAIAGGGVYTANAASAGVDRGFNWTAGTCTNYCHSRGTSVTGPTYSPPVVTSFTWSTASLDCAGCHGAAVGSTSLISTNAHSAHINDSVKNKIGRSFVCTECHNATASTNTQIKSATYHVNKQVNIKFDDASINKNNDLPTYQGVTTTVASGASVTTGVGNNTCANVYCHSIGNLSSTNPANNQVISVGVLSYRTPTWSGASLNCDACHGDQAGKSYPTYTTGSAGSTTANSHVQHIESGSASCDDCHAQTTISTTITVGTMTVIPASSGGKHLNRVEDVVIHASKGTATYQANKTCSSTYCHGSTSSSGTWGGNTTNASCTKCHGVPSTTASYAANNELAAPGYIRTSPLATGVNTAGSYGTITSYVSNDPAVGAHDAHLRALNSYSTPTLISCSDCHSVPASSSSLGHNDSPLPAEVVFGPLALSDGATPSFNPATRQCTNVYCHGTTKADTSIATRVTPSWSTNLLAGTGGADCGKCHGNPPNTGGHSAVTPNQCQACHDHATNSKTSAPFFEDRNGYLASMHLNGTVDGGAGGGPCFNCHAVYQNAMSSTGSATRSSYHHVLTSNSDTNPGTGVYPTSTSLKYCVSCHTDHDYFSSNKSANLRQNIASTNGALTLNSDYSSTLASYGICVSCHTNGLAINTTGQLATGLAATTLPISGATFSAGSHNYNLLTSFGTSTFYANCSKCHDDEQVETKQTSAYKVGTHFSAQRRLVSKLGITTPTDPLEEKFCYRCHSRSTDLGNPGGGPPKGTANADYYSATTMTVPSQLIFRDITSSMTGTPSAATTTSITDAARGVSKTAWTANQWIGYTVKIISGPAAGEGRRITASNATVLTVTPAFTVSPTTASVYVIGAVHDTSLASGSHRPVEGTASGWMTAASRHVGCEDCHDPHGARPGKANANGTVGSSTASSLTVSGASPNWQTDRWKGYTVNITTTARGQARYITGNTGNTLTIQGSWSTNPSANDTFTIETAAWTAGGVATAAAGANTITDANQTWGANAFTGYYVKTVSGNAPEQVRKIASNTATVLTLVNNWTTNPAIGTGFVIYQLPLIAGVNTGIGNVVTANFETTSAVSGTNPPTANMRNVSYATKTGDAQHQYELCLKCHSVYAYGSEGVSGTTPTVPSPYAQNSDYDNFGTLKLQTDVGRDFDPDNYAYHPLFAPGKMQPLRMGNPSANAVGGTIAYNANWPFYNTGTITYNAATKAVTGSGTTFPLGVGAGYWLFIGSNAPTNPQTTNYTLPNGWWPVASRDSATQLTLAAGPATVGTGTAFRLTKGYKSAYVDGWGPESLTTCTDCHNTTDNIAGAANITKARGPHGSANRWLLRFQEVQTVTDINGAVAATTVDNPLTFCLNCHSKNVYGDAPIFAAYTAGANANYGRVSHAAWNACVDNDGGGNFIQIMCTNCHGGQSGTEGTGQASVGSIHGNNLTSTTAGRVRGFRFQNGASWAGKTIALGTTGCYVNVTTDAIHSCTRNHAGTFATNFQY